MDFIDNYVLYMDSTYSVKAKGFDGEMDAHFDTRRYILEGIDTEFFILAVFIDNKRVDGFQFDNTHVDSSYHTDSLFMKSIINDFGATDLNTIPLNHFLPAYKKVMFQINRSFRLAPLVDVSATPVLYTRNTTLYGIVRPTFAIKNNTYQPRDKRALVITHRGSENGLTEATIFPYGIVGHQFVNQFIGLNAEPDNGFQEYPADSVYFGIDDIHVEIAFLGNQNKYFELDIECLVDENIVNLSLSSDYRVSRVQPYAYGKTQWEFVVDKLLPNSNDTDFTFNVYIDWKALPQIE